MLSEDLRRKLESLLQEGENVLWADVPVSGLHRGPYFVEEAFSGVLALLIGILFGLLSPSFLAVSVIMIAAACVFLGARLLFEPLHAKHTVYAVTDRRILFIYPQCYNQIPISDIRVLDFDEKQSVIGHVFFVPRERYYFAGTKRKKDTSTKGCIFVNISDPKKVHLLIALQRKTLHNESL